jgi:hypothetical protein
MADMDVSFSWGRYFGGARRRGVDADSSYLATCQHCSWTGGHWWHWERDAYREWMEHARIVHTGLRVAR